jgi:glycosyltransferase 2 family protein
MRKSFVTVAQYVIFLGLGIFLLWLTTRNLSDEELTLMKQSLLKAKYILIIPAMVLLLASHYSRALRWKILMEPLGFQPKTANTFFAVMLSYFFNLLVPRLGEVMKCTILARYEKTPVDKLVGTMVAERAFDFICLVLVVIITIFIQIDVVGGFASVEFGKIMAKASQDPKRVIIPVIAIIVGFFIVRFLLSRYAHISIVGRIKKIVRGVWEGLTSVRHVKRKTAFFLHTIFIWSMYLLSIQIGFYTMESVAHLGIKPSFTILSFGSLAMIVTQGGIGAYQLAVEKTLTLYGIAEVNGLAYGWLLWLVQTLMVLGVGFLCLMILPIYNRKRHERSITG